MNNNISSTRLEKKRFLGRYKVIILAIALNVIFFPQYEKYTLSGDNRFEIMMGNVSVGVTDNVDKIYDFYREARKELAKESEGIEFYKFPNISSIGKEVNYGRIDSPETIINNMVNELSKNKVKTLSYAYEVKVNDVSVNVRTADEVRKLFDDAIARYDVSHKFDVSLERDMSRQLDVLNPVINNINEVSSNDALEEVLPKKGFEASLDFKGNELQKEEKQGFESYEYGIMDVDFSETIEVVSAYLPSDEIMDVEEAENLILNNQEVEQVYKVQSGDTLSEIAIKLGLPLDDIIALNDDLENENSLIRPDQELLITVPEPKLSVLWSEQAKLEESYNVPTEYIYNDSWYTNKSVVHQQPSAGYHEAVLQIKHVNDSVESKDTLYEEIVMQPVAKVIEVGTQIPPTYIKPISGGRMTSTFGPRRRPTKGASSNHKGIDWATPIGTSVVASCGGTVASAGWSRGYGYCVTIRHPDGKQTRYGHLSKILVSAGQTVSQGQKIALSGNTGVSTGPHIHFEILVNGSQVNPLNYIN